MDVLIALYRGINVGGKNSVKMEALRVLHERLGHQNVKSHIQSGNIIFQATQSPDAIAPRIVKEFAKQFGFPAKVIVVSAKRWEEMIKNNPYSTLAAEDPKLVHVGICSGIPDAKGLKALLVKTGGNETFVTKKEVVYLYAPDGIGKFKFGYWDASVLLESRL